MVSERFNTVYKNFKYGLVRIDDDLKIVDKNRSAEALMKLPRRGAKIIGLFADKDIISGLGRKYAASAAADLNLGGKRVCAVAFREKSGTILLLFHPLLANISRKSIKGRASRIVLHYMTGILEILGESEGGWFTSRALPGKMNYPDISIDRSFTLKTAVRMITEKFDKTDLAYNLTVIVDKIENGYSETVNFTLIQYALTEAITVLGLYGEGKHAVMNIGTENNEFVLTVRDRMNRALKESDKYFARVFTEIMKLIGVGSSMKMSNDGFLELALSVPVKRAEYVLKEPSALSEDELWGYFDYCMEYFGTGKKIPG